jgi:hypothetical protein
MCYVILSFNHILLYFCLLIIFSYAICHTLLLPFNPLLYYTSSASTGFIIYGPKNYANLGNAVSGAGDVNGDGYDDVLVGAWQYQPGMCYVILSFNHILLLYFCLLIIFYSISVF